MKKLFLTTNYCCKCAVCILAAVILFVTSSCTKQTELPNNSPALLQNTASTSNNAQDTTQSGDLASVPQGITAEFSERDLAGTYDKNGAQNIEFKNGTFDANIDGIILNDNILTISKAGTYVLSGEFNGGINIYVSSTDKVQLVLNGVDITSTDGPAINGIQSDKIFITLLENTENTLTDSSLYSMLDEDSEPSAALFSKDDMTINGKGSLKVNGNYMHGIVSKDDLTICNADITVNSKSTGIRGRDELAVTDSSITVFSGTNSLDSNNDSDEAKGNIIIENSTLTLTSNGDAVQAKNTVQITNTEAVIVTASGAPDIIQNDNGMEWHKNGVPMFEKNTTTANESTSSKGIKAKKLLRIDGGSFEINAFDDAVHSNGDVVLSADTLNLASGDDGIHADSSLYVLSGSIEISKSYEGLEGNTITVFDGSININASDDGMNAAGGVDSSGMGGMAQFNHNRQDKFNTSASDDVFIKILGGNIHVNASGDGMDTNGALIVSGGTTIVEGPENNGNGALDYLSYAKIDGGFFIAVGSSGMALNFSQAENQCAALVNFKSTQNASTPIALFDSNNNLEFAFAPSKQYSSVVVSAPSLIEGGKYELKYGGSIKNGNFTFEGPNYSGGSTYSTLEFTSNILNVNSHGGNFGGGGGRPNGR